MIKRYYTLYFSDDKTLARQVRNITGYVPKRLSLYKLALRHSSLVTIKERSAIECNERLEFLGDTILDTVISEYLFRVYPMREEGFLTEMRAKIVNRQSLNDICRRLRLDALIKYDEKKKGQVNKSMYGDALEAFIGAVFMDLGYEKTRRFVEDKVIRNHIDLSQIETKIFNYKSLLLEYVQKEKLTPLSYELVSEEGDGRSKTFTVDVVIGQEVVARGRGPRKKVAEQNASEAALIKLELLSI